MHWEGQLGGVDPLGKSALYLVTSLPDWFLQNKREEGALGSIAIASVVPKGKRGEEKAAIPVSRKAPECAK